MRTSEQFDRGVNAKCRKSGPSYVSINDLGHAWETLNPIPAGSDCRAEWIGKNPDPAPVRGDPDYVDPIALKHTLSPKAELALYTLACRARHAKFLKDLRDEREERANPTPPVPAKREPGTYTPPPVQRDPKEVAHAKRVAKEMHHIRDLEDALATARARLEQMT